MSTVLKFRRGDTSTANAFTGAEGELFVDTTKDTLVVHDGVTLGGNPLATESYVITQISYLIDSAPTTLDTLNELAAALGDDANFATTITNQIGLKANTADLATVATSGSYNDLTDKPSIPTVPTTLSSFTNDVGFITNSSLTWNNISSKPAFSTVATSGSYNDLTDKPSIPSLNGYATETYVNNAVSTKQDTLVSGNNIKTINGEAVLGSGDLVIATNVLTYGQFVDSTITTSTTESQVLDTYSVSQYRTSKYIIQAVGTLGIHSVEVLLIHDDSSVYMTQLANITSSGSSLFTLSSDILSGNVRLLVTPASSDISFDVVRTSLAARAYNSLQGDLMSLSGTEDLQTSSGSFDLNA